MLTGAAEDDHETVNLAARRSAIWAAAQAVLETFAAAGAGPADTACPPGDTGPAILAAVMAAGHPVTPPAETADRALVAWLRQLREPCGAGLFGGAAGRLLALRIAATAWPRLDRLASAVRGRLCTYVAATPWAATDVGWGDYDLITGPAGILLAFAADPGIGVSGRAPLIAHLARLCADDELNGLRIGRYRDDALRGWNYGHINMGLAHGLPGVLTALRASADADGLNPILEEVLRRLASRLCAESFTDSRGVLSWTAGSRDGSPAPRSASRRHAWCYGCPGIAWTLWEAGRVLGDDDLRAVASQAATSFIRAYDDDFYLFPSGADRYGGETLGICHGAGGLLAIFDSFARHTDVTGAATLRDHLTGYLGDRLDAVAALARGDCSLQDGASGVMAALLTVAGGDRRWLAALGLR
jgi:hypothetical protein